jgi:hypothetical protein
MDESEFQRWWALHLQVARGRALGPEEKSFYDAGRHDVEADEKLQSLDSAKVARQELLALRAERTQSEQRRQQLDAEIAALEGRLDQETRELLGVEGP